MFSPPDVSPIQVFVEHVFNPHGAILTTTLPSPRFHSP